MKSIRTALITAAASVAFVSVASLATSTDAYKDKLTLAKGSAVSSAKKDLYIVQLRDAPAISHVLEAKTPLAAPSSTKSKKKYDATSSAARSYTDTLRAKQLAVLKTVQKSQPIYHYTHAFNGFSAQLTPAQANKLRSNPDVAMVWQDELQQLTTANTPEFLGLNGPSGQHTLGVKGEGVIVGIIDTGIWPEHPSFADDGSYGDPAELGWNGECITGEDEAFHCNNKLIGARYFKDAFEAAYAILPDEYISPRDADGHGSHVAGTAAGNENVTAVLQGTEIATVTGMAPRARIAMYKACWNSDAPERGCFYGDVMASIEAAIADGVDVINMSIGGSLTDLTTPPATQFLIAADAGVFAAVSAGNSGPDASTVGTPAPWVTNVAASSYDGESAVKALEIVEGPQAGSRFIAEEGSITRPLSETGDVVENVVVATPLEACFVGGEATPLDNANALAGKIALIQRGSCAFSEKVLRAQASGATAVIVFNNSPAAPIVMGGDGTGISIPGMMIGLDDGASIVDALAAEIPVVAKLSASSFQMVAEVGNVMADFSSRGPNLSTMDVIKPDITAPGVKILAAHTAGPMFGVQGETFRYLQGTSMSSPHIAGLAALLVEQHPDWTPAMIKSALMTTARQNVVKEDGETPADPFDFGAGHAMPAVAADPGLVYDAGVFDYLAFMCGLGEGDFVVSLSGYSCDAFVNAGYSIDPSQLNLPSIAIAELDRTESIARWVTNVGGTGTYTATVESPAGVNVSVATAAGDGSLTLANGATGWYVLNFELTDAAVFDQWVFGSVSWSDGAGHVVRSPIAVKPVAPQLVDAPATLSTTIKAPKGTISYPVLTNYSGRFYANAHGLVPATYTLDYVLEDNDAEYAFNEPGLGLVFLDVPEGTKVAKFTLSNARVDVEGADLDMYVYRCEGWSCAQVGASLNAASEESVILIDPTPAADIGVGDTYLVFVHGYSLGDAESANYILASWMVGDTDSNTQLRARSIAREGRYTNITLRLKEVIAGAEYLGAVSYMDGDRNDQGLTVIEAIAE